LIYPLIWIARRLGGYGHKEKFKPITKEQIARRFKKRRPR
jgi:hypothetical protein